MIDGIDDDPAENDDPTLPRAARPPGSVTVSGPFYRYLQECADLVASMSTDPRPLNRMRALEWRLACRTLQHDAGKLP